MSARDIIEYYTKEKCALLYDNNSIKEYIESEHYPTYIREYL